MRVDHIKVEECTTCRHRKAYEGMDGWVHICEYGEMRVIKYVSRTEDMNRGYRLMIPEWCPLEKVGP